jgi:ribulose-phosphate 3-epimerase
MTPQLILAPSMIASDFTHLADEIADCESGGAGWLHLDVMDGHFVPQITIGPLFVEACKRVSKLPLDVHLMIEAPEKQVEAFARAGANNITVHVEACDDLARVVGQIHALGCTAGVALNPSTPVSAIEAVLPVADLILVMSVEPGFSGQVFMPEMTEKAKAIRARLDMLGLNSHIEADGGISVGTLPLMRQAGANVFVTGNAAFKHPQGTRQGVLALHACLT